MLRVTTVSAEKDSTITVQYLGIVGQDSQEKQKWTQPDPCAKKVSHSSTPSRRAVSCVLHRYWRQPRLGESTFEPSVSVGRYSRAVDCVGTVCNVVPTHKDCGVTRWGRPSRYRSPYENTTVATAVEFDFGGVVVDKGLSSRRDLVKPISARWRKGPVSHAYSVKHTVGRSIRILATRSDDCAQTHCGP